MAARIEPVLTIADLDAMPEDGNRYWIVDPHKKAIQIYRSSKLRLAATLTKQNEITTPLLPGFHCQVRVIFQQQQFPFFLDRKEQKPDGAASSLRQD